MQRPGIGDFFSHARVGHQFCDDDDGDDRQVREAQADEVVFKDLCDFTNGSTLVKAAQNRGDEDHDTGDSDPGKGVRFSTGTGVDRNRRFNRSQRSVDEREEFRRADEKDEDQDEDHSCFDAFAKGNSFLIVRFEVDLVFRIARRLAGSGIKDDDSHDDDGRNHNRQFSTDGHGNEQLRDSESQARKKSNDSDALDAFRPPPIQITIKNGTIRSGIKDTMETFVAKTPESRPVTAAMVVVGIPMEPNEGATALEIKQATMVLIGG